MIDYSKISMRDAFFNALYDEAKIDRNIVIVSADMGAPALDKFRRDLAPQYVNTGIAEQNAMLVASGLALSGKKPYVYAIAPFVSTRIHEFAKLEMGLMKLPITIVAIGAGYSYDDSGPTHHNVEDISIMRAIPNIEIWSPSDSELAAALAKNTAKEPRPSYIRLDRKLQRLKQTTGYHLDDGFSYLPGIETDVLVAATGNMVDLAEDAIKIVGNSQTCPARVDISRIKPLSEKLEDIFRAHKKIISLEEHVLDGGFGSALAEFLMDRKIPVQLKRVGVTDYNYEYGGRAHIQERMNIGCDRIVMELKTAISR